MRKTKLFSVAALLAVSVSPVLAAAKAPISAQACWQPAFLNGDAAAVALCYAPGAVLWLPGAPMMKGRDAIREGYAGFFKDVTIKSMKLVELGKVSHGDEASSWGTFTLITIAKADGKEHTELGRYNDVTRKFDGHWMYLADHASDDPAPSAMPAP